MKKFLKLSAFVVAIVVIFVMAFVAIYHSHSGLQYNKDSADCIATTCQDDVSLREGPSNSDAIVLHLSLGTSVSLTGHTFNDFDGKYEIWHEVITMSGHTGWILAEYLVL